MASFTIRRIHKPDSKPGKESLVKLSEPTCASLDVTDGDYVVINGRTPTVARVQIRKGSQSTSDVWMNELCLLNSGLGVDDSVTLEKPTVSDAKCVVVAKPFHGDLNGRGEAGLKNSLMGRVVHSYDLFGLQGIDGYFRVLKKAPFGAVEITENTRFKLRAAPAEPVIDSVLDDARSSFEKTLSRRGTFESMLVQQIQLVAVSLGLFLTFISVLDSDYPPRIPLFRIPSDAAFLAIGLLFLVSAAYSLYNLQNKISRKIGPTVDNLDALLFDFDSEGQVDVQRILNYQYWFDHNNKQNRRLLRLITNGYILLVLGWVLLLLLIALLQRPVGA